MKSAFSNDWKNSTQTRKQRKYQYNAPLHVKQKFAHVHLSKELAKKQGSRSMQIRMNDKVKILRGAGKGKSGKVERVDLKRGHVYIAGIETIKKDGSKVQFPVSPSNLMITELSQGDKKRKQKATENGKKSPEEN